MSDDLMRVVQDILLPMCKHCGSRECGPYRCRFIEPDHVVVRGLKFRDLDDAHDYFVQREVDGD